MHDKSKEIEAMVSKFGSRADLEVPRYGCDFGSKNVKVTGRNRQAQKWVRVGRCRLRSANMCVVSCSGPSVR